MFTITAKTDDHAIEKSTVSELRETLEAAQIAKGHRVTYNGCKKTDLVQCARSLRDELATKEAKAKAEVEQQRLAQLAAEQKLPHVSAVHQAVMECLNDQMADAQKKVNEFFAKISESNNSVRELTYQLGWRIDDLYFAEALNYNFAGLAGFFGKQLVEQTYTSVEVAEILQVELDRHLNKLMDSSLRADIRPVEVIKQTAEYNAAQRCAKLLKRLIPAYTKAVTTGDTQGIERARWCL